MTNAASNKLFLEHLDDLKIGTGDKWDFDTECRRNGLAKSVIQTGIPKSKIIWLEYV